MIRKYQCKKCGLFYKNESLAKQCEDYCKSHKSCNIEITKYAINQ